MAVSDWCRRRRARCNLRGRGDSTSRFSPAGISTSARRRATIFGRSSSAAKTLAFTDLRAPGPIPLPHGKWRAVRGSGTDVGMFAGDELTITFRSKIVNNNDPVIQGIARSRQFHIPPCRRRRFSWGPTSGFLSLSRRAWRRRDVGHVPSSQWPADEGCQEVTVRTIHRAHARPWRSAVIGSRRSRPRQRQWTRPDRKSRQGVQHPPCVVQHAAGHATANNLLQVRARLLPVTLR